MNCFSNIKFILIFLINFINTSFGHAELIMKKLIMDYLSILNKYFRTTEEENAGFLRENIITQPEFLCKF